MQGGDRGLELVRTASPRREGPVERREPLVDHVVIPPRPVLLLEQHEVSDRVRPRLAPRVLQEHEREQTRRLRLVRHQPAQHAAEADRLVAELGADERSRGRGVALVEHEVQDGQDAREPVGQELARRDAVRDPGRADLPLRADDPLGHRGLGDEEGVRDLAGRQAPQRLQRERHAGVHRQRRVAAGEDQPKPVVRDPAHVGLVSPEGLERGQPGQGLRPLAEGALPPEAIDRAVAGGRDDPGPGAVGEAPLGPGPQGLRERLLDRLLRQVEVAEDPDQGRDGPPPLLAEQPVGDPARVRPYGDSSGYSETGRTSTDPMPTLGILEAASIASSRLAHCDEVVAAELLLRLRERAVGRQDLPVALANGRGRGRRLERVAAQVPALALEPVGVVVPGLHLRRLLLGRHARPVHPVLVAVDQQQVVHVDSFPSGDSLRRHHPSDERRRPFSTGPPWAGCGLRAGTSPHAAAGRTRGRRPGWPRGRDSRSRSA